VSRDYIPPHQVLKWVKKYYKLHGSYTGVSAMLRYISSPSSFSFSFSFFSSLV